MLTMKKMSLMLLLVSISSVNAEPAGALTIRTPARDFSSAGTGRKEFVVPVKPVAQGAIVSGSRELTLSDSGAKSGLLKELPFSDVPTPEMLAETQGRVALKKLKAPEAAFLDRIIAKACPEKIEAMKDIIRSIESILMGTEYKGQLEKQRQAIVASFAGFGSVVRAHSSSVIPLIKESLDDHTLTLLGVSAIKPVALLESFAASTSDAQTFFAILTTEKEIKELAKVLKQLVGDVLRSWPLSVRANKNLKA